MAPESERAMYPLCTNVLRDQGKPYPRTCAECGLGPCKRNIRKPNEPTLTCSDCGHPKDDSRYHLDAPGTNWGAALHAFVPPTSLTCSEVVERLATECFGESIVPSAFNRDQATAILHEWLDRHLMQVRHDYRTDLKTLGDSWRERRVQELEECLREVLSSATPNEKEHPTMFAAWTKAEQIRKGAKCLPCRNIYCDETCECKCHGGANPAPRGKDDSENTNQSVRGGGSHGE